MQHWQTVRRNRPIPTARPLYAVQLAHPGPLSATHSARSGPMLEHDDPDSSEYGHLTTPSGRYPVPTALTTKGCTSDDRIDSLKTTKMTTNRPAIRPSNTIITHHRSPRTAQGAYALRHTPRAAAPGRPARATCNGHRANGRRRQHAAPPASPSVETASHGPASLRGGVDLPTLTCPLATALTPLHLAHRVRLREWGGGRSIPPWGPGSMDLHPPYPLRKSRDGQGSPRRPCTGVVPGLRRSGQGSVLRHPAPPCHLRSTGGRLGPGDPSRPATRRDRTARWRTISGGGGTPCAEGLCPQSPNPQFGYVSVGSLFTRARPHIFDFSS